MRLALVTPPTEEPVTLAEAKLYLRIGSSAEDALIGDLVTASRELCEAMVDRSFVSTVWDLFLDGWPIEYRHPLILQPPITLPRATATAVESVKYFDADLVERTLDPARYAFSMGSPGRITPASASCWPTAHVRPDAIAVRFTAGYGAAADVPRAVRSAVLLTLAHLYENRGESDAEMPRAAAALLAVANWGAYS